MNGRNININKYININQVMTTVKNLPVTLQDQQHINRYSYLIYCANKLGRALEATRAIESGQREAAEEMEVLELEHDDDGAKVSVQAGNAYFHLPLKQAKGQVDRVGNKAMLEAQALQQEHDKVKSELGALKRQLEGKFGESIRLE